jgi:hypothetical protein
MLKVIFPIVFILSSISLKAQESTISDKLDKLDWNSFRAFDKYATKRPKSPSPLDTFRHVWGGELILKGANLFYPCFNGFEVYDLIKMEYGKVKYSICDGNTIESVIQNPATLKEYFFTSCWTKLFKIDLDDDDYSQFDYYQYPYYDEHWIQLVPDVSVSAVSNADLQVESEGKIYTYEIKQVYNEQTFFFDYNTNANVLVAAPVKAAHNNLTYALISEKSRAGKRTKIIDVNRIINDYGFAEKENRGNGLVDIKKDFSWKIDNIKYLSNNDILLILNVTENFVRYYPNQKHGLPLGYTSKGQLAILLNGDFSLIKAQVIIIGDNTVYSETGDKFYKIINAGSKVICYDSKLNMKWFKEYGMTDDKTGDNINYAKEVNGVLYLMGTTKNKYHVGSADPIVWKVNSANGNLISETVVKLQNPPKEVNGFLIDKKSLYLALYEEARDDYYRVVHRCFLTKVDLMIN